MNNNLKDSFQNIKELTDKNLYNAYEDWQKWLLIFRGLSNNTASSYSYDFKYFLNFVKLHFEKNKISISILNNLTLQDYRAWISYFNLHSSETLDWLMYVSRLIKYSLILYYHISSHYTTSNHIISCHVLSYRILSYRILSYHIVYYHA